MYNKCHLVHADFSEYNLLYQKGIVYVIDVSQSVEHDHPHRQITEFPGALERGFDDQVGLGQGKACHEGFSVGCAAAAGWTGRPLG